MVNTSVTAGRVAQSHVPNALLPFIFLPLAFGTLGFLLTSITKPPDGNVSFAGEAGKAEVGMVFTHFCVQDEKFF